MDVKWLEQELWLREYELRELNRKHIKTNSVLIVVNNTYKRIDDVNKEKLLRDKNYLKHKINNINIELSNKR